MTWTLWGHLKGAPASDPGANKNIVLRTGGAQVPPPFKGGGRDNKLHADSTVRTGGWLLRQGLSSVRI